MQVPSQDLVAKLIAQLSYQLHRSIVSALLNDTSPMPYNSLFSSPKVLPLCCNVNVANIMNIYQQPAENDKARMKRRNAVTLTDE